jgi:hypothetical protein
MRAIVLTRQPLGVDSRLTDETLHRIAYDVRAVRRRPLPGTVARSATRLRLGTTLLVAPNEVCDRFDRPRRARA